MLQKHDRLKKQLFRLVHTKGARVTATPLWDKVLKDLVVVENELVEKGFIKKVPYVDYFAGVLKKGKRRRTHRGA